MMLAWGSRPALFSDCHDELEEPGGAAGRRRP